MESLQQRRYDLEEQIQKIRVEMSPVLEKLGEQITMRRIQSEKLHKHYKKMDSLEDRLENLREKREKCKRECGSISFALKVGYYGVLFAGFAAVVVSVALILT
jgi:chromosome segregation ATPase